MEANNAESPSYPNATKVLNLTDYDFTIRQLGKEVAPRVHQLLPDDRYGIIKSINWEEDASVAAFIIRTVLRYEVKERLLKPDYIIIEVPVEHRGIVKEALEGLNIGVLYVKTTQVELKDGQVLDVKLIEQEEKEAKETMKPKVILNLTNLDFTDRQIRDVYDENYEIHYPEKMIKFDWYDETIGIPSLFDTYVIIVQDKINKMKKRPDCVIVDVPEEVIPYISEKFRDSGIRFIYTRTVLVEMVEGDPLKVKLLSKVEE